MKAREFIQTRYLHMKKEEAVIWTRFLTQTNLEFDTITYDLHLGEGMPISTKDLSYIADLKRAVTRKRVDAIGENSKAIWIFEVKPRIGMSTIGQLLVYWQLYLKEYPTPKPVYLGAVGERKEPDLDPILLALGIVTFLV